MEEIQEKKEKKTKLKRKPNTNPKETHYVKNAELLEEIKK